MSLKDQINLLFKEIKVYSSQALYDLAKQKCSELAELVKGSDQFRDKNTLLDVIFRKIGSIEDDARYFEGIDKSTKMTEKEIDIVKRLVSASGEKDKDAAAWEVAKAFQVLRQFEKALEEFNRFIDNGYKKVAAAKSVLQCHIELSATDEAIKAYKKWFSSKMFSKAQLLSLKTFLKTELGSENIDKMIEAANAEEVDEDSLVQEDSRLVIKSVKLSIKGKSNEELGATLKVVDQTGETLNVIVPKQHKELIMNLKAGLEIQEAEFYSDSIIFNDSCKIIKKQLIESGKNSGDCSVWLTVIESDPSISE